MSRPETLTGRIGYLVPIGVEELYGHEIHDRVFAALVFLPRKIRIKHGVGTDDVSSSRNFFASLHDKVLDMLKEPDGIQRLEDICARTVELLAPGRETVYVSVALDHHWGSGMDSEEIPADCYQQSSIDKAELYLREAGILAPAEKTSPN